MAYQALYRQWRPTGFSDMVGQETVVATLRRQVATDRVSHAYLFCGSRGTGKTSVAKIMSRAVNCENPQDGSPCGRCPSCKRLLADESIDVQEIDAASNNGVDEVRELRENVKYPPQQNRYKVYIIDEVHMLSSAAFNALLKTLEEPPQHTIFILATTEPEKLPATILSRCQRFDFGRIPAEKIAGRLRQAAEGAGAQTDEDALLMIAAAAEGGMRDALSILDMCIGCADKVDAALVQRILGTTDRSFLFRFSDALCAEEPGPLMKLIDELIRSGRDPSVFARSVAEHLRALLLAKSCPKELASILDLTPENASLYAQKAEHFRTGRLISMLDIFLSVESDMRWSSSPRMALESAAIRACVRTGDTDTLALAERISELEKQLASLQQLLAGGRFTAAAPAGNAPAASKSSPESTHSEPKEPLAGDAVWKAALDEIKRTDGGKYAFLRQGRYCGCDGTEYRWTASETVFVTQVSKPEFRSAIEQALAQAAGQPCTFVVVSEHKQTDEPKQNDDPVKLLRDALGAENVLVVDSLSKS